MSSQWQGTCKFFKNVLNYIRAIFRVILWTIILFFSALQRALFTRTELVGVDMRLAPFKCDVEDVDDKLSYIDKLCIENPDLAEISEEAYLNDIPFDDKEEGD